MLDEVANIAPLGDLPDMLSEGGGQGLQIVACLQDVAQARARWGDNHGLLSKCRT
jgi:type IV secretory pathway TraG/TraD family ATPase VirD4